MCLQCSRGEYNISSNRSLLSHQDIPIRLYRQAQHALRSDNESAQKYRARDAGNTSGKTPGRYSYLRFVRDVTKETSPWKMK